MAERVVKLVRPRSKVLSLPKEIREKRVAAYARVSTDSDEQMGSVEAQKDYFEKLIREKPGWVLVGVYADEGISGTSLNRREAFARMIDDAMDGKIDLIVTKSISRFARNTVDALNIIRKLKLKDVGVYFENEDISTLDSKGEFLITLMSSLAEEESRSISENVRWGQRKRFADGRYHMPYKQFLGYKKGANGEPELVEEEAKIIRIIYRLFLEGYSTSSIAEQLTEAEIPSPSGMNVWQRRTVESILKNEKYYGAALLQKTFCVDYRTKTMRKNQGELPMYYVENGHEAIVTKEIFEAVQEKLSVPEENLDSVQRRILNHNLSGKLFCSECGSFFGPIPIHSTTYNDLVWKCSNRHLKGYPCKTPYLYEEMLYPIFHEIIVSVLRKTSGVVRDCVSVIKTLRNSKSGITQNTIFDAVTDYDISSKAEARIWRTAIDKVTVHPGHLLEFHMIDGSRMEYRMMKTSPRKAHPTKCAEEDINNDYINGFQIDFLAQKYGFSIGSIKRILNQHRKESPKDLIIKEYIQGKKPAVIAREMSIPSSTVRSIIYRAHLTNAPAKKAACLNCGNEFEHFENSRKYCCRECSLEHRYSKRQGRTEG